MKMLDVGWLYLPNCGDLEFNGKRLGDLGPRFHSAFSSQLTLFLQNGSTLGNQIIS